MFRNVALIPPGTGMAHQVSLESLSRVVFEEEALLFPDSVVGTDSHITMVNGLGILGWGEYTATRRVLSGGGRQGVPGRGQQVAVASEIVSLSWQQEGELSAGV